MFSYSSNLRKIRQCVFGESGFHLIKYILKSVIFANASNYIGTYSIKVACTRQKLQLKFGGFFFGWGNARKQES